MPMLLPSVWREKNNAKKLRGAQRCSRAWLRGVGHRAEECHVAIVFSLLGF